MAVTGYAVSVVPATSETGEVTVAPLAGEQMVTEGEVGFSVHCAADLPASSKTIPFRTRVNSRILEWKSLLPRRIREPIYLT
jgi:hypothetical protein